MLTKTPQSTSAAPSVGSTTTATTPRSRSRSKRSTTNLSNLRLAPLSTKYTIPSDGARSAGGGDDYAHRPKTPSDEVYARQHSSYLQGKSAPTTPGILSRSSSRRSFSGGLSRRDEQLYDESDDDKAGTSYAYTPSSAAIRTGVRAEGDMAKSKSEAALGPSGARSTTVGRPGHRRHLSGGHGLPHAKRHHAAAVRSRTGTSTPLGLDGAGAGADWLAHTGSRASALLQEGKGQSWMSSLSTPPPLLSSDDDGAAHEDENYEEMAALSASTAKLERFASRGSSGGDGRARSPRVGSRWGSRYGSRGASARTSRYGSPARTPRARDASGYFDEADSFTHSMGEMQERAFVDEHRQPFGADQAEVDRLSTSNSFGLGPVVDRIMGLRIFGSSGVDAGETTDEEGLKADETETEDEAKVRMAKESKRRREEKEKLAALSPAPVEGGANGEMPVGGWQDAAWLLSVATKAMF